MLTCVEARDFVIPSAAKRLSMQSQEVNNTKPKVDLRMHLYALGDGSSTELSTRLQPLPHPSKKRLTVAVVVPHASI